MAEVFWCRVGTSGGVGLPGGTVVVSAEGLMADADHGYGNALNVMRTVQELEASGIAALTIEDTALPRPFDETAARPVSIAESLGKMKAAVAARSDPALVILARTGAIGMTGLEDTLERLRAYETTGVDGLFLAGVRTRAEVAAIRAATTLPLVFGTLTPEIEDRAFLAAHGVRIALQGHSPFMATIEALRATYQALREGTSPVDLKGQPSDALVKQVSRDADWRAATNAFLMP
jgi:carboxyvinyl-carboxyphosphonate phosphorylmutase